VRGAGPRRGGGSGCPARPVGPGGAVRVACSAGRASPGAARPGRRPGHQPTRTARPGPPIAGRRPRSGRRCRSATARAAPAGLRLTRPTRSRRRAGRSPAGPAGGGRRPRSVRRGSEMDRPATARPGAAVDAEPGPRPGPRRRRRRVRTGAPSGPRASGCPRWLRGRWAKRRRQRSRGWASVGPARRRRSTPAHRPPVAPPGRQVAAGERNPRA